MARKRPQGWWYPWIFVGVFGVVFAVNMTMVKFVITSYSIHYTKLYEMDCLSFSASPESWHVSRVGGPRRPTPERQETV